MTNKEALEMLKDHNDWRRSEGKYKSNDLDNDDYVPVPYKMNPKDIGIAIDLAIKSLGLSIAFETWGNKP